MHTKRHHEKLSLWLYMSIKSKQQFHFKTHKHVQDRYSDTYIDINTFNYKELNSNNLYISRVGKLVYIRFKCFYLNI